jgi:hypothetical protein
MMPKREFIPMNGSSGRVGRRRAGSSLLGVLAGVTVLGTGTTAAALAAAHSAGPGAAVTMCQTLPAASPPGARPTPLPIPVPDLKLVRVARALGLVPVVRSMGAAAPPSSSSVQLCASVQAVAGTVEPGQSALFTIRVWPTGGTADNVTAQIALAPEHPLPTFPIPAFTYCDDGDQTPVCTLGPMQAGQTGELQAEVAVPSATSAGTEITLATVVTGTASGAVTSGSVTATATVDVVAAPPTSPTGTHSSSPSSGGGHSSSHGKSQGSGGLTGNLQPGTLPSLASPGGTETDPSALFPTIGPAPGSGGAGGSHHARITSGPYRATAAADVLPLNAGQLGAQIAGLLALAIGVCIAIARVSLRRPGR